MSETHQPLRVRAVLASGIASTGSWGIALDGLLAAQLWETRQAQRRDAGQPLVGMRGLVEPPDLDLPLARCTPEVGPWHWAATCAWPTGHVGVVDVRWFSARLDHRHLEETAVGLPRVVSARQGRYRAKRMPVLVTPTPALTWQAVGDVEGVRALVEGVVSIGKKRSSGEGHVLAWAVEAAPDLDHLTAGHLHPDHSLGRPVPAACRDLLPAGTRDGGTGRAGIRPPHMHPARAHHLVLPAPPPETPT